MAKEDVIEADEKMGHANNLLERLQQASNELNMIKSSFSKNMDELDKIQGMLSVEGLNRFNTLIEEFQQRLSEAEKGKEATRYIADGSLMKGKKRNVQE